MAEKKETKEVKETKEAPEKDVKETKEEVRAEAAKTEETKVEEEKKMKESTERNRQQKAERREAKAARKAANIVEEKKRRPNNALIAILIFGVMICMFAFIWGYNYYKKAASIEKYMEDKGMTEMYSNFMYDEYTTAKLKAEGNTIKMVLKVNEDAPEDELEHFKSDEGKEELKEMAAYFLTSMKPEVRGLSADCKIVVKQGDTKLNSVKMTYRQAKKFQKEAEKKAAEGSDDDDDDADGTDTDLDAEADTEADTEAEE